MPVVSMCPSVANKEMCAIKKSTGLLFNVRRQLT